MNQKKTHIIEIYELGPLGHKTKHAMAACGQSDNPRSLTYDWDQVTCKHCLKRR